MIPDIDVKREKVYKAAVLRELLVKLAFCNKRYPLYLYARPVTDEGLRLLQKYRFRPVNPVSIKNMESLWERKLLKGELDYDTFNTRRAL